MNSLNPAIIEKLNGLSQNVLSDHYIFNRDMEDIYLAKRFSTPDKFPHNLGYGISDNPQHIKQYYNIREQAYREVLGEKNFDGGHDHFDDVSYLYLVTSGFNCVGGVRLTISSPEFRIPLPLETADFKVADIFSNIDSTELKYCEASRLALLPEFRQGRISDELIVRFVKFLVDDEAVSLGFGRSTALQARRFKSQFQKLGLPYEFVIRPDIKVSHTKSNEHLGLKFWAIDFTADQRYADKLSAPVLESVLPAKELEFA